MKVPLRVLGLLTIGAIVGVCVIGLEQRLALAVKLQNRRCPDDPGFSCPPKTICQPQNHCGLDLWHKCTNTSPDRICESAQSEECLLETFGCLFQQYNTSNCAAGSAVGAPQNPHCYNECAG